MGESSFWGVTLGSEDNVSSKWTQKRTLSSGTSAWILGSESFLSAAVLRMTDVGVKESGDELAWEWTGAVSSPCRRRKFSFCSSSFLLIKAWREEE